MLAQANAGASVALRITDLLAIKIWPRAQGKMICERRWLHMQGWEYGYVYVLFSDEIFRKSDLTMDSRTIVVLDSAGPRILEGASTLLAALNSLGAEGWIISEGRRLESSTPPRWLPKFLNTRLAYLEHMHFMRRPMLLGPFQAREGRFAAHRLGAAYGGADDWLPDHRLWPDAIRR